MANFKYTQLNTKAQEIRLVTLKAGHPGDDIFLGISHTPLIPPKPTASKRLSLSELEKTLPQGWFVTQTLTGRYLFICDTDLSVPTSWDHPDPTVDRSLYSEELPEFSPIYEALSYTWGDMNNPVTVYVQDGSSHAARDSVLKISQNLACALQHLRYRDRNRTLWIDAICLNQSDISERNGQVKRMGSIYALAHRVTVWLGPGSSDSTHALKTLEYFAEQVEHTVDSRMYDPPNVTEPEWLMRRNALPYDDYTWQSLIALFGRPWFTRVWVLQETMLANTRARIRCGEYEAAWEVIPKAVLAFYAKNGVPPQLERKCWDMRNAMRPKDSLGLLSLLSATRARDCGDLKDKFYGILGLTSPSFQDRIQVRYEKTVAEVYKDAFLAYTEHYKRSSMLCYCTIEHRLKNAPSWIPNWAVETSEFLSKTMSITRYASGRSRAEFRYVSPGALELSGLICAEVESLTILPTTRTEIINSLRKWQLDNMRDGKYGDGSDFLDTFLEVIFRGRTTDRYPGTSKYSTLAEMRKQFTPTTGSIDKDRFGFLDTSELEGTALITTKEGYIGLTPKEGQPGDKVCIILGCDVPILLRPTLTSSFLVIGPCFVQGLLDAEALLGQLPSPWKLQMLRTTLGYQSARFVSEETEEEAEEDPRLPPLPKTWRHIKRDPTNEDPWDFVADYENIESGEILNSDPRMLSEALVRNGVKLEWLRLV
ncbi:hypothetical protein FQN54_009522 [Arachnomyces sp. PD_36]|nr:hypothetical protein FQN54_009522 [Arachnomyces sp. PD_36]